MKTNFDTIRLSLINRTNAVMVQAWRIRAAVAASGLGGDVVFAVDDLERLLDALRNPVVAIGCLESDGGPEDAFKALDFNLHAARVEDDEDGDTP